MHLQSDFRARSRNSQEPFFRLGQSRWLRTVGFTTLEKSASLQGVRALGESGRWLLASCTGRLVIPTSRLTRLAMTMLALTASCLFLQGQAAQPGLFTIGDPSPDLKFGVPATGQAGSAGRIVSLVMAPDGQTLYAAAEISGVWKSADGAHTWTHASNGLFNGRAASHASLAIDGQSSNRLLFASGADDGRPNHPYGGLWVSNDSAATWGHVQLCAAETVIRSVIFASGQPYVATQCGLWTTGSANLATGSWTELSNWPQDTAIREMADGGNGTVFTCAATSTGATVYRVSNLPAASFSWRPLPGECFSLAPAPTGGGTAGDSVVVAYQITPQSPNQSCQPHLPLECVEVAVLDLVTGQAQFLGRDLAQACCGRPQVRTAQIGSASSALLPGFAYDVYATDGCRWFALDASSASPTSTSWKPIMPRGSGDCKGATGIHVDAWDMAFGPNYDPPSGKCTAYASTDGGIYASDETANVPAGGCVSDWVFAQSGLHALNSTSMGGIPLPFYQNTAYLFLPTGDNDVWARPNQLALLPSVTWFPMRDNLGDAGQALVDPLAPEYAQVSRNEDYRLATGAVSSPAQPPPSNIVPTPSNAPCTSGSGNCYDDGVFGAPGNGGIAAVLTLLHATDVPTYAADFVAVAAVNVPAAPAPTPSRGPDMVLRCEGQDCNGPGVHWTDQSPSSHFNHGIAKVLASGGHTAPVIYVLTPRLHDPHPGQIWRSSPAGALPVTWTIANGTGATSLKNPVNFFVNPYAPTELYAVDAGDRTIKASIDGGQSWNVQWTLTQFATNSQVGTGNAYYFGCGGNDEGPPYPPYTGGCALSGMSFDPFNPTLRVATSEFGGLAFSRDSGRDWMPLNVTNNVVSADSPLTEQVNSAFYYYPKETIYAALHGGSMLSVTGPFPALEQMTLIYPRSAATRVLVNVSPTGLWFWLTKDRDGSFSGTFLFDSSRYKQLTVAFGTPPFTSRQMTYTLTAAELLSGVAVRTCTACVP